MNERTVTLTATVQLAGFVGDQAIQTIADGLAGKMDGAIGKVVAAEGKDCFALAVMLRVATAVDTPPQAAPDAVVERWIAPVGCREMSLQAGERGLPGLYAGCAICKGGPCQKSRMS